MPGRDGERGKAGPRDACGRVLRRAGGSPRPGRRAGAGGRLGDLESDHEEKALADGDALEEDVVPLLQVFPLVLSNAVPAAEVHVVAWRPRPRPRPDLYSDPADASQGESSATWTRLCALAARPACA